MADRGSSRRDFLKTGVLAGGVVSVLSAKSAESAVHSSSPSPADFEHAEATLATLGDAMLSGAQTSRSLCEAYLARIEAIDRKGPELGAVIATNPDALAMADALDRERKAGKVRGPLHGIPVLVKDNCHTKDAVATTGGSLALAGLMAGKDSTVAAKLRAAGAVILAKTNLSEWANFRSTRSTSGWSGVGGQCRNPYDLERNPSGSSSGTGAGISANLGAVGIGTETDGSITAPSSASCLVGIKPTVGLIGRTGIIPISHTQDTAGPMTRTVTDAAVLLGALEGFDPEDAATRVPRPKMVPDYTRFLDPAGLKGARIGVCRGLFTRNPHVTKLVDEAIAAMKSAGATIVDPADLPPTSKYGDAEFDVLLYEFKADLAAHFAWIGAKSPMKTLADVIAFNNGHVDSEMPFFDQEIFVMAEKKGPLTDPKYLAAVRKCRLFARTRGIDLVMTTHKLDALVAPTAGPAWFTDHVNGDSDTGGSTTPAAVAGYPSVTVPAGFVMGLPVGVSFFGRAWTEGTLIKLAYAFEQTTKARRPPNV